MLPRQILSIGHGTFSIFFPQSHDEHAARAPRCGVPPVQPGYGNASHMVHAQATARISRRRNTTMPTSAARAGNLEATRMVFGTDRQWPLAEAFALSQQVDAFANGHASNQCPLDSRKIVEKVGTVEKG